MLYLNSKIPAYIFSSSFSTVSQARSKGEIPGTDIMTAHKGDKFGVFLFPLVSWLLAVFSGKGWMGVKGQSGELFKDTEISRSCNGLDGRSRSLLPLERLEKY